MKMRKWAGPQASLKSNPLAKRDTLYWTVHFLCRAESHTICSGLKYWTTIYSRGFTIYKQGDKPYDNKRIDRTIK